MQRVEREEALKEDEYKMRESICELEKWIILGEEDNDHGMKRRMLEESSENVGSHGFSFNYLC